LRAFLKQQQQKKKKKKKKRVNFVAALVKDWKKWM